MFFTEKVGIFSKHIGIDFIWAKLYHDIYKSFSNYLPIVVILFHSLGTKKYHDIYGHCNDLVHYSMIALPYDGSLHNCLTGIFYRLYPKVIDLQQQKKFYYQPTDRWPKTFGTEITNFELSSIWTIVHYRRSRCW